MMSKKVLIIAGPNGAGKTTFAREFLPSKAHCPTFLNADLIAAGLSPFAPDVAAMRAGRIMLEEISNCEQRGLSFAIETTLSGLSYRPRIQNWRANGYRVTLIFLALPSPELAIARVAQRVRQGGHNVAELVIRRRCRAGFVNFKSIYRDLVDGWALYDNSGPAPILTQYGERHEPELSHAKSDELEGSFAALNRAAQAARQLAIQTNTAIVFLRDGQPTVLNAAELRSERHRLHNATSSIEASQ